MALVIKLGDKNKKLFMIDKLSEGKRRRRYQHPLGIGKKCERSGPIVDLLNQNSHNGTQKSVYTPR